MFTLLLGIVSCHYVLWILGCLWVYDLISMCRIVTFIQYLLLSCRWYSDIFLALSSSNILSKFLFQIRFNFLHRFLPTSSNYHGFLFRIQFSRFFFNDVSCFLGLNGFFKFFQFFLIFFLFWFIVYFIKLFNSIDDVSLYFF